MSDLIRGVFTCRHTFATVLVDFDTANDLALFSVRHMHNLTLDACYPAPVGLPVRHARDYLATVTG